MFTETEELVRGFNLPKNGKAQGAQDANVLVDRGPVKVMDLLREVAEPSRRNILAELKAGPKNVGELVDATGLKQPNVSNHLAKLRSRGLVKASKVGRQVYYTLANPEVAKALAGLLAPEEENLEQVSLDSEVAKSYAKSAVAGDEEACARVVDVLIRQGMSVVTIYHGLFSEALSLIARWFEVEAVDEGQQSLAIGITDRLMARVMHYSGAVPSNGLTAVLGGSVGDNRSLELRMMSDVMARSGWRTLFLGGSIPARSFLAAIQEHRPSTVVVSCSDEESCTSCAELLGVLAEFRNQNELNFKIGIAGAPVARNPHSYLGAGADYAVSNLIVFAGEVVPMLESRNETPEGVFASAGQGE